MRFWTVKLSCALLDTHWRHNAQYGIVANTIDEAIHEAKGLVPEGAVDIRVWSAHHQGNVDLVATDVAKGTR